MGVCRCRIAIEAAWRSLSALSGEAQHGRKRNADAYHRSPLSGEVQHSAREPKPEERADHQNRSGLQVSTIRNIAAAWVFTLPMAALLSASLFWLFRQLA